MSQTFPSNGPNSSGQPRSTAGPRFQSGSSRVFAVFKDRSRIFRRIPREPGFRWSMSRTLFRKSPRAGRHICAHSCERSGILSKKEVSLLTLLLFSPSRNLVFPRARMIFPRQGHARFGSPRFAKNRPRSAAFPQARPVGAPPSLSHPAAHEQHRGLEVELWLGGKRRSDTLRSR